MPCGDSSPPARLPTCQETGAQPPDRHGNCHIPTFTFLLTSELSAVQDAAGVHRGRREGGQPWAALACPGVWAAPVPSAGTPSPEAARCPPSPRQTRIHLPWSREPGPRRIWAPVSEAARPPPCLGLSLPAVLMPGARTVLSSSDGHCGLPGWPRCPCHPWLLSLLGGRWCTARPPASGVKRCRHRAGNDPGVRAVSSTLLVVARAGGSPESHPGCLSGSPVLRELVLHPRPAPALLQGHRQGCEGLSWGLGLAGLSQAT